MPRLPLWPPIKERRNRGGSTSFVVECGVVRLDGKTKRIRHYCKSREEAEKHAREARVQRRDHGRLAALERAETNAEMARCMPFLQAKGVTVTQVVRAALSAPDGAPAQSLGDPSKALAAWLPTAEGHASDSCPRRDITVGETIEEWIAERIESKKGEKPTDHEKISKLVLRKAFRMHLDRPIRLIGVKEVKEALRMTTCQRTRQRWYSAINQLFTYAAAPGIGYILINPMSGIVKPPRYGPQRSTEKDGANEEVEVLTTAEVVKLLEFVQQVTKFNCMVIPICLQLFCGLRRVEVYRFLAKEFESNQSDQYSVKPKLTRSRMNRWVTKNKTFGAFLRRWWKPGDPVYPENYATLLRDINKQLGLKWTRNILRHTFASNYFRIHGEKETVREMGHAIPDTTFKFYLRKVAKGEALDFWNIKPILEVPLECAGQKREFGTRRGVTLSDLLAEETSIQKAA